MDRHRLDLPIDLAACLPALCRFCQHMDDQQRLCNGQSAAIGPLGMVVGNGIHFTSIHIFFRCNSFPSNFTRQDGFNPISAGFYYPLNFSIYPGKSFSAFFNQERRNGCIRRLGIK